MSTEEAPNLRTWIAAGLAGSLSDIGQESLAAFLALPFVEGWKPDNVYLGVISSVFNFGLPFALLRGNSSAARHRTVVGSAIGRGTPLLPSLMSEVHAGALLSLWKADPKFLVPQKGCATSDIQASWTTDILAVEVARASTREVHEGVKKGVRDFSAVVQASDLGWNLLGFISDASRAADLDAMFDAATQIRPGESAEHAGKWSVCALEIERREEVVSNTELFAPAWWPKNEPCDFAFNTVLGGSSGNPYVQVRSLVPHTSYMNPIIRKADSGQRIPGKPYLIALDVSEFPRAHDRILGDLYHSFAAWDHVSGVLLFEPRFFVGYHKQYVVSLHKNHSATCRLPDQLLACAQATSSRLDFHMLVSRSDLGD